MEWYNILKFLRKKKTIKRKKNKGERDTQKEPIKNDILEVFTNSKNSILRICP